MVGVRIQVSQDSLLHQGQISMPECEHQTTRGSTVVDLNRHTVKLERAETVLSIP